MSQISFYIQTTIGCKISLRAEHKRPARLEWYNKFQLLDHIVGAVQRNGKGFKGSKEGRTNIQRDAAREWHAIPRTALTGSSYPTQKYFLEMETSCFFNIRNSKDSLDLSRNYIHDFGSYHFQIIYLPPATQSSTSISPISARSRYPSKSTAHEKDVHPSMAGHTDIFPKNLFWYHLLTALAYKPPGPIINKDLIGNIKGIT
jgi:hypothetical protein